MYEADAIANGLSDAVLSAGESLGEYGEILAPLAGLGLGLYILAFGVSLAVYLLNSIAMMRMAGRTRTSGGWMAFFPIFDIYLLGKVADAGVEKKHHARRIMTSFVLSIIFALLYGILSALGFFSISTAPGDDMVLLVVRLVTIAVVVALLITLLCHAIYKLVADYRICVNFGGAGWFFGILFAHLLTPLFPAILRQVLASRRPKATN